MPDPVVDTTLVQLETDPKKIQAITAEITKATKGFTDWKVYRTTKTTSLHQSLAEGGGASPTSKLWLPAKPAKGSCLVATIPAGTTAAIGVQGGATQWYVPDTFGANKKPPATWKLSTLKG